MTQRAHIMDNDLHDLSTQAHAGLDSVTLERDDLSRRARLSLTQVTHVAGMAQRNVDERDQATAARGRANAGVERATATAEQERAWRERAQRQVAHAARLGRDESIHNESPLTTA